MNLRRSLGTGGILALGLAVGLLFSRPSAAQPPAAPATTANDRLEPNDSANRATNLGNPGGNAAFGSLTINFKPRGVYDFDWYRAVASITGNFTVTVNETSVNGDLEIHLYRKRGAGLRRVASNVTRGINSRSVSINVTAGETIYIHVKGRNSSFRVLDTGGYDMFLGLSR
jgi:hypothetical protein